jgi:hypothetical protein
LGTAQGGVFSVLDRLHSSVRLANRRNKGQRLTERSLAAGRKGVIKMNKKMLMGIMALALSLMFTSTLMAEEKASTGVSVPAQKAKVELFNGVVESVDMAKKDMVVEFHKDKMSFSLNDQTKIFDKGTKELKLSDLKKGEWASVEYNKEGSQRIAQSIRVSSPKKSEPLSSAGNTTKKMMSTEKAPKTSLNW